MRIAYTLEPELSAEDFRDLLIASTLAARRPVDDPARLDRMLRNANIIVTARHDGKVVGVSRALSDFSYCCYLSDLAVDVAYQRGGIGKRLIEETRANAGPEATLVLLSAPAAESYYPRIGAEEARELLDDCANAVIVEAAFLAGIKQASSGLLAQRATSSSVTLVEAALTSRSQRWKTLRDWLRGQDLNL